MTAQPQWYGAYVAYTDVLDLQAFDPVISETSGILGEQAGLSFDTLMRNTVTAGATKDYAGTATQRSELDTTNDKVDYADFLGALALLEVNNALPGEGNHYPVVMHPYSYSELMQDATFVALFTQEGGESIRSGRMGTILNCAIYVSSNARTYTNEGSSNSDPASMLFIGRESYGIAGMTGMEPNLVHGGEGEHANLTGQSVSPVNIIVKELGETGFDPLNQRGTIGWKATYDDVILNSSWVVDLEHCHSWS